MRPAKIIEELELNKPIFKETAKYGHFGREDIEFSWERINKVEEIKEVLNTKLKNGLL